MAKRSRRPKAALNLSSKLRIGDFIVVVRGISLNIANNAGTFPAPLPAVATVNGHIDDLQAAEDLVQTKVLGSASTRDLKYDIVLDDVFSWQNYVQSLADFAPDEAAARNIITLSGFGIKVNGVFERPPLVAKFTITPGTIKLIAKSAGPRSFYNWQQSINGAISWIDLPPTMRAKTFVGGLTSGSRYMFRVRSLNKDGLSGWSNPVGIVIQ